MKSMKKRRSSKQTRKSPLPSQPVTKLPTVREAAKQALRVYRETFRDLARYDRGEQAAHTVSK
jgi:hypothetical protein